MLDEIFKHLTMADLTLQQRFGTNATYNHTNKTITINLNDLTDTGDITGGLGLDLTNLTAANINSYAARILYQLLLLNFQKQAATNNDETVGIYITNTGRRDVVRNNINQFAYTLSFAAYTANNLATILDPDLMV
jgi:hypothetical protein